MPCANASAPPPPPAIPRRLVFGSRRRRRKKLRAQPLPAEARATIERNVPFVSGLPASDRAELEGLVQVFLDEKWFQGCGGLELDDEMRLTIAAQACVLLLRLEENVDGSCTESGIAVKAKPQPVQVEVSR